MISKGNTAERKPAFFITEILSRLDSEENRSFFHVLDHFHSKRAAFLAGTARDAIGRVRVKGKVMLANGRRYVAQVLREIVILVHSGDVDFLRAGQAVIAVHTSAVG